MWRSLLGRACGEIPFHPTGERSVPRWVQGALEPPARVRTHIHTHRVCPCLRSHSPYRFQDCHSDRHVRMGRRRPRPPMDRQADRVPRRGALSSPGCASSKGLVAAQAEAPLNPRPGRLPVVATSRGEGSPAVGTEAADPLVSRGRAGCPGQRDPPAPAPRTVLSSPRRWSPHQAPQALSAPAHAWELHAGGQRHGVSPPGLHCRALKGGDDVGGRASPRRPNPGASASAAAASTPAPPPGRLPPPGAPGSRPGEHGGA